MKTRLLAMGSVLYCAAAFAACGGGGGGGGGGTPPGPTATPIVTPTPTVDPYGCVGSSPFAVSRRAMSAPPHPIAAGDAFTYTGSIQTTYQQSAPCAQPTSSSSATVSATVTNFATSGPGAATTDQRSVETDAYPTKSVTTTTDLALTTTPSAFQLFQTKSSDTSGNTVTLTYANAQQLDVLTGSPPQSWGGNTTNNPAGTYTENLADGTSVSRTISSDGSYVDHETYADGTTATITVAGQATGAASPDGSGSYAFGALNWTFLFAPPAANSIALTVQQSQGSINRTFPAWFTTPASYITDNFAANGTKTLDPSCSVSFASQGNQIVETYSVLDPALGYKETRTTTSYVVNGYGPVCVVIDDTIDSFYDWNGDTTVTLYYSHTGQPNSVNHIVEVLSMTAPATPYAQSRVRQSTSGVSAVEVASRIAAIQHVREIERAQRAVRLHELIKLHSNPEVLSR